MWPKHIQGEALNGDRRLGLLCKSTCRELNAFHDPTEYQPQCSEQKSRYHDLVCRIESSMPSFLGVRKSHPQTNRLWISQRNIIAEIL